MLSYENTSNSSQASLQETTKHGSYIQNIIIVYKWVVITVLCQSIALFGVGTNIINIMCFVKQGFKDPVNVSLLGMAISDLGALTTIMWSNLCTNPEFGASDLPFEPLETQYLITGMPHTAFTTITAWITALITLERCLCITYPLKIKTLITPRRVAVIVGCVFIILMFGQAPTYVVNRLGMKYFPHINKTRIGLLHTEDRDRVEGMSYAINNVFLPLCAFLIIITCTITLVIQLRMKTKWRTKSTSAPNAESLSSRNQKVARMVIMISTLFISCFTPTCLVCVAMSVIPGLTLTGKHKDFIIIPAGIAVCLESINSSSNIFIYFQMSSKYKTTIHQLFFIKAANVIK